MSVRPIAVHISNTKLQNDLMASAIDDIYELEDGSVEDRDSYLDLSLHQFELIL
jgi:hypothetical protein